MPGNYTLFSVVRGGPLNIDNPIPRINTVNNAVLIGQPVGIAPHQIANQLLALKRIVSNHFDQNLIKLAPKLRLQLLDVFLCPAGKPDFICWGGDQPKISLSDLVLPARISALAS